MMKRQILIMAAVAAAALPLAAYAADAPATNATAAAPQHRGMHGDMNGMGHGKGHGGMFAEADKDGDGSISKSEFMSFRQQKLAERFDKMDTNHDGKLSKEEMMAARKNMRSHMREKAKEWKQHRQDRQQQGDKSAK